MIDVHRLRVLLAVAEHGSFNRAASALGLTPSAVSQHIASLERGLGRPVAVRSTRGVTLTEAGRLLTETARTIDAELNQVRHRIDRLAAPRPRLTVATFTSGGRHLLPPALTAFVAAHPEVELTVLEAEPEDALPMVRGGQADLALTYRFDGPLPSGAPDGRGPTGVNWVPLAEDPLYAVLPPGHPLAGRDALEPAELAADRWVLGCLKTEAHLRRYAERVGFELRIAASTTDYFFAQTLVGAGVGVALIPHIGLAPAAGCAVVPLEPPGPARHIGMVTPRRPSPEPYANALTAALSASAAAATPAVDRGPAGQGGRPPGSSPRRC
ncbi:LysR family transcriptional regulator [Streptomyces sp. NPDC001568]|uniref:LysR family transcriptional regulator n=1 Tax=Streptomyces sp. NPDC001568 TaxID=3364588 RepID=UPI00369AECA9